ncbi:hypothetical protein, partial [Akkermansia sp.]|uniref:hypothetical protein n=1 Tax=Akkermansia sp. TaxID=1872421 RepID=UPI003A867F10
TIPHLIPKRKRHSFRDRRPMNHEGRTSFNFLPFQLLQGFQEIRLFMGRCLAGRSTIFQMSKLLL